MLSQAELQLHFLLFIATSYHSLFSLHSALQLNPPTSTIANYISILSQPTLKTQNAYYRQINSTQGSNNIQYMLSSCSQLSTEHVWCNTWSDVAHSLHNNISYDPPTPGWDQESGECLSSLISCCNFKQTATLSNNIHHGSGVCNKLAQ